jgi:hypothetical protein
MRSLHARLDQGQSSTCRGGLVKASKLFFFLLASPASGARSLGDCTSSRGARPRIEEAAATAQPRQPYPAPIEQPRQ